MNYKFVQWFRCAGVVAYTVYRIRSVFYVKCYGCIIASKNIDKNTAVEAYADVGAFKPKGGSLKKEVQGYNLNVTKQFKAGGMVKKGTK